jgi:NusA family KH domain protein, archaeal
MGLAIGKSGENIKKLATVLGRKIEMVEWDEKPEEFIANCFKPAQIVKVEIGETVSVYMPDKSNIGLAIGKGGATIEKARTLVKRFFGKDLEDMKTLEEAK